MRYPLPSPHLYQIEGFHGFRLRCWGAILNSLPVRRRLNGHRPCPCALARGEGSFQTDRDADAEVPDVAWTSADSAEVLLLAFGVGNDSRPVSGSPCVTREVISLYCFTKLVSCLRSNISKSYCKIWLKHNTIYKENTNTIQKK